MGAYVRIDARRSKPSLPSISILHLPDDGEKRDETSDVEDLWAASACRMSTMCCKPDLR